MPSPDPVLAIGRLRAGYGAHEVLRGVSLSVAGGEVVGLVGPNGSGKTTIVRVASRALRPAGGWVRVSGVDPFAIPGRSAARLVAVVPQDVLPAFSFTVLEIVLMGRAPYLSRWGGGSSDDWARAREAMASVGVQHLADRPVEELSGGERRRVILAQALAQDAPVLLLDEPTTHLDIKHVSELLALVRGLAEREGKAVLAVLHDLTLAATVCDRLVALAGGEVVASGRPEEVVTRSLLRAVYGVEADVETSRATGRPAVVLNVPDASRPGVGRRAHVVGGAGRGARLMRMLAERGYRVSAGVLHGTDSDHEVAERLDLLRVSVPPFSVIDDASAEACLALMRDSDFVVVCDMPVGPGNLRNLELALRAAESGVRVFLMEQVPIEERDFTGGKASELMRALREIAGRAATVEEILSTVG